MSASRKAAMPAADAAIKRPVTPPQETHGTHLNHDPNAGVPHRSNLGIVNVNGDVNYAMESPAQGTYLGNTMTAHMFAPFAGRDAPFAGYGSWTGPPAVSGQLAHPEDPFISSNTGIALTASAPAFVPGNFAPPPPPGSGQGGSSHQSDGDSSSNNNGYANSGNRRASDNQRYIDNRRASCSSSRNGTTGGQCSDDSTPVIANGSTPNRKGKEPIRTDPLAAATRFIRVENVRAEDFDDGKPFGRVKALHGFKENVQKNGIFAVKSDEHGNTTVFMYCDSKSEACNMYRRISQDYRETCFLSQQEFNAAEVEIPEDLDRFSAKVVLAVTIKDTSLDRRFGLNAITDMAKTAAAKFGKILQFRTRYNNGGRGWAPTVVKFEVEYDSVKDAYDIILNTNTAFGECLPHAQAEHIIIRAQAVDTSEHTTNLSPQQGTGYAFSNTGRTGTRIGAKGQHATTAGYSKLANVASRTPDWSTQFDNFTTQAPIYEAFDPVGGAYMLTITGQLHRDISRPQDVIDQKIVDGSDVRCTLMIRNLPPEFSDQDLINILNMCCFGKYDFAYNRIDFRQNQSVGYGFINFISAEYLLRFVRMWRGKLVPHNVYRRHLKPCAVSYANVQGYECLVAKFRNSSILEEAEGCRPKLFWSDETAPSPDMVGQQRPWPQVDNDSKKARSMENAQTLGLYTPRRANGARGGGRMGRFSRFDRGTSAQQNDEQFNNYNVSGNATMAPFGYAPRYQPQGHFDPRSQQFVPAANTMQAPMAFQAPYVPYAGPQVAGSMLRSHTNGQLGYTQPVMPAHLAPVTNPSQGQAVSQEQFTPLLFPQKGQVQKYYRQN